jgi:hypothetical protein
MWQSVGYWIAQQGVARGEQPWYYFIVIGGIYEFLALLFGILGAVYYLRRNDEFGYFLIIWSVVTFALYTIAAEKMPWLLVAVVLPFIVLAGKYIGGLIERTEWKRLSPASGVAVVLGVGACQYRPPWWDACCCNWYGCDRAFSLTQGRLYQPCQSWSACPSPGAFWHDNQGGMVDHLFTWGYTSRDDGIYTDIPRPGKIGKVDRATR